MKDKKVSVIIPVYNRERYIEKCVHSVINQTYPNIEIIIVDDGSYDQTKLIVKNMMLKYPNIKYFYKHNGGVSSARNFGIRISTGEFIMFLDSDDEWDPTIIEKQLKSISKSGFNVCYCGMYKNKIYKNSLKKDYIRFKTGNILFEFLKEYMNAQTITWLIRKDILIKNNIMFDEELSYGEDLLFFLKILTIEKCCCVSEYLAYYNMHKNSLTNNIENQLQIIKVWDIYINWLNENKDISESIKNKIYRIIRNYRLPANILRTFYDSYEIYGEKFINMHKEQFNYVNDLNIFLGPHKIRLILYYLSIKNIKFYRIIEGIRQIKSRDSL